MKNRRKLTDKVRKILIKICPAFDYRYSGGGAIWHKCYCLLQMQNSDIPRENDGHCKCVWYLTDTCEFGKWRQLAFVKDELRKITYQELAEEKEEKQKIQWKKPENLLPRVQEAMRTEQR